MRTYLECIPCFLQQALAASRMVTTDPVVHELVVRETLRLSVDLPFDRSPPWMAQRIHRLLRDATGNPDPYQEVKRRSNATALRLYPMLEEQVRSSADPFATAVWLAIAGNIIDFGCRTELTDDDIHRAIKEATNARDGDAGVETLRQEVGRARDILYLADNAGEIVFDRLLIQQMPTDRVTLAVRGGPVINDATLEDAKAAGLDALMPVVDNGSDAPGTILDSCSAEFQARFEQCDLVVAKGQGNYETLGGQSNKVIFLLKIKCPVIARDIGGALGEMIVWRDGMDRESASEIVA